MRRTGLHSGVSQIQVNTLDGDDAVAVDPAITLPTTLTGGLGDDAIVGGGGPDAFIWSDGDGSDTADGRGGIDTLVVTGSNALKGDKLRIRAGKGQRSNRIDLRGKNASGRFSLDIGTVELIRINTQAGNDKVAIGKLTGLGVNAVEVNAGAGNDKITA